MGKLNQGILGGFSGTVGTVVGSTNKKGEDIIRAKSKKARQASSVEQVIQQTKFSLTTSFMQAVNPILKIGMKQIAEKESISAFNYACRHALKNAVTGTDAQPELDFSRIILSDGNLSRIAGVTAEKDANMIKFSWTDDIENITGAITDKVSIVVYNVTNSELSFSMGEILRSAKTATLPIPYSELDDKLVFYLFFQSATNPAAVSTSQYLGSLTIE